MDIGQMIKEARMSKGLTQEELGKLVGVQKSAVAKWENGRVVNIKRSSLKKLAIALDMKGSDLIDDIAPVHQKPAAEDELTKSHQKPAGEDGLTESHQALISFARTLSEEQAEMMLRVMQAAVASRK